MNWKNLSVAHKLWGTVLGSMAMMLLLGVAVLAYVERTDAQSRQGIETADARIAATMQWRALTELSAERFVVSATSSEAHLVGEMTLLSRKNSQQIEQMQQQIEGSAVTERERPLVARLAHNREQFREVAMAIYREREGGSVRAAIDLVQQRLRPNTTAYIDLLGELVQLQEQQREQMAQQARAQRQRAYLVAGAITLALVACGVLLSGLLVRSITQPLAQAVGLADAIAAGDLRQDVQEARRDELGQLLRALSAMARQLRSVVGQVRGGVDVISGASSEIASGNQDLSMRTEQSAASLQQSAASMEQLTATVAQSAETARQANRLAASAAQAAEQGGRVVGQVVTSMQHISDSSRRIADIIGVIDSIAFQTNILALNAAVEAARAGDSGRGFAVVAGEVRQLAQRSAEAAKQIKELIGDSTDSVQAGSAQVEQAGQSMHAIVEGVRRVSELIGEITASSSEQADGIAQVNQAVAHLDRMTQQNAALVEQSSAAAAAMHEQAQRLAQVVAVFQVGAAPASPSPALSAPGRPTRTAGHAQRRQAALVEAGTPSDEELPALP